MDPIRIRHAWLKFGDIVLEVSPLSLFGSDLPPDDVRFLCAAGLPKEAAPFLSFAIEPDRPLRTVAEACGLPAGEFGKHLFIGHTGSGDPIALLPGGSVGYLNHDTDFETVLINSSVRSMLLALLAFRELVAETQRVNGDEACLEGRVPVHAQQAFVRSLQDLDPAALEPETMWAAELRAMA